MLSAGEERDAEERRSSGAQASEPPERETREQRRRQGEGEAMRWREMKRDSAEARGLEAGPGAQPRVRGDSSGISKGIRGPAPALTRPRELNRLSKPN